MEAETPPSDSGASHVGLAVKNPPAKVGDTETQVRSLGWDEGTAPHSSTLAWRVPWAEEPGGLQSMGSQGLGHD